MNSKFVILLGAAAVIGAGSFFLMPNPLADTERALGGQIGLGGAMVICFLQLSALWFFLTSLKTFKASLRKAYYVLSAGLLIFSLAQVQLPLAFVIQDFPAILQYFIVLSPFLLGPLVMYLGVRRFARILEIHNLWARVWVAIGIALLAATIPTILSIIFFGSADSQTAIVYGLVTWGAGFALAGSMVAFRIRGGLSPAYSIAMKRLGIALAVLAFACLHEVVARTLAFDVISWYTSYNLSVWGFVAVAVLMLWAALAFRAVTEQYSSLDENASELDTVIHTAELASIPAEIEGTMNKVRKMTASRSSSELTEADKHTLVDVYGELESYLINKDPLRKFNREDLRNTLPAGFRKLLPQT